MNTENIIKEIATGLCTQSDLVKFGEVSVTLKKHDGRIVAVTYTTTSKDLQKVEE